MAGARREQVARELRLALCGPGGGGRTTPTAPIRTRAPPPASGCGRGIGRCAMRRGRSARSSTLSPGGQIDLPAGTRCMLGDAAVTTNQIGELARVTGDAELALSSLYGRLVESRFAAASGADVLAAERAVVRERFRGGRGAYLAALTRDRATVGVARGVLADEVRRAALQSRLQAPAPTATEVERFYGTYAPVLAREVEISPAPSWLPNGRGVVLASLRQRGCSSCRPAAGRPCGRPRVRSRCARSATPSRSARCRSRRHDPPSCARSGRPHGSRPTTTGRCAVSARHSIRCAARATAFRRSARSSSRVFCRTWRRPRKGSRRRRRGLGLGAGDAQPGLARALGAVERLVGALEEADRVVLGPELGDPRRDLEPFRLADRPRGHRRLQAAVEALGVLDGRLRENDRELVTADAARDVGASGRRPARAPQPWRAHRRPRGGRCGR